MSVEKVESLHEQVLNEEGMNVSELPEALQRKIRGWNQLVKRLERYPEDEKLLNTINRQSIELADSIQDFIENDFEDDDEDEGKSGDGKSGDGSSGEGKSGEGKSSEGKSGEGSSGEGKSGEGKSGEGSSGEEKKQKQENQPKRFGNLVMEKKITDIIKNNNGRISVVDLERIIGKEPDYPEQEVHNIKLRKVFMASDYRLL